MGNGESSWIFRRNRDELLWHNEVKGIRERMPGGVEFAG
jgi:hypothetical protein